MRSPWYRSRLFALGLVVWLCLMWTWLGYYEREVHLSWITREATYVAGWGGWGEVAFVINRHLYWTGMGGGRELGFHMEVEPLEPLDEPSWFAPAVYLDHDRVGIFVGHWLLVLIYLVLWIGAMVLWQGRKRRRFEKLANSRETPCHR